MKVNIKSIITTNIDNIIRKVVDRSNDYYISNIREYGAPSKSSNEIVYIPLHGDVDDINSRLFFGKFELSDVENSNSDLFKQMFSILSTNPTLFWGYNFNDNGVLKIIKDIIGKSTSDIWVQVLPDDSKNKKLFEGKGCHIIEANTKELLEWIQTFYQDSSTEIGHSDLSALEKYMVPSLSKVPKIPTIDYFKQGITEWYPVLAGVTYERDIIAKAENLALEGKNNFSPKINPVSPAALERRYNQPFGGEQLISIYLEMLLISLMRQYTSSEEQKDQKKSMDQPEKENNLSPALLKTDSILFNRITDYYEAHITEHIKVEHLCNCLLYTSDAADD